MNRDISNRIPTFITALAFRATAGSPKRRPLFATVVVLISAFLILSVSRVVAEVRYSVTDLGTLPGGVFSMAADINNHGQVVGYADYRAFLYSGGHMTDLGTLPAGSYSHADAINDNGQIVGVSGLSGGQEQAFLYSGGKMTGLGNPIYSPADINNQGEIVGVTFGLRAFLYSGGILTDLGGSSFATGINNNSQVVGQNTATSHAFLYSHGHMTDLGTLGGAQSTATGINDLGQVVGYSYAAGNAGWHAFLYEAGQMTDLGIFPGGSGFFIQAKDINVHGEVVGTADSRGFLYRDGAMVDLNTLIASEAGWILGGAEAINDHGQIVGTGYHTLSGQNHAYLLTVIPEPVTFSFLALGGLVLMLRRRCRQPHILHAVLPPGSVTHPPHQCRRWPRKPLVPVSRQPVLQCWGMVRRFSLLALLLVPLSSWSQGNIRWFFDNTNFVVLPSQSIAITATATNLSLQPLTIQAGGSGFSGDLQKSYNFTWQTALFGKTIPGHGTLTFAFGTLTPIGGYVPPGTYFADPADIQLDDIATQYSENTFQIVVVPEPTALLLALLGPASFLALRLIRRLEPSATS